MRSIALLAAMIVAGCASEPSSPQTHLSTAQASAPAPVQPQAQSPGQAPATSVYQPAAPTADVEAQRLARAKNLNLKVMNKDGQQLYCRSNFVTASRIQRDTTCYTADQVEQMEERMTHELDQFNQRPSAPPKGLN
jgi:hypothetical protein